MTIDNCDYRFAAAYDRVPTDSVRRRVADAYVACMERMTAYYEQQSVSLLGREIPHVLLLHANPLNAEHFGRLARMYARRGYTFVPLERAPQDPAYASPDTYTGLRGSPGSTAGHSRPARSAPRSRAGRRWRSRCRRCRAASPVGTAPCGVADPHPSEQPASTPARGGRGTGRRGRGLIRRGARPARDVQSHGESGRRPRESGIVRTTALPALRTAMPSERTTAFEWSRYADATLAGLSVLIPVPFMDDAFEGFFRGRIPGAVARARGRTLPDDVRGVLGEGNDGRGGWAAIPLRLTLGLAKRLSRKVLYFLTIKTAADRLNQYWSRAFLIDHGLTAGHLENAASARVARKAMDEVLAAASGPLPRLANQVIASSRNVWPALRRARRGEQSEEMRQVRTQIEGRWDEAAGDLRSMAGRYDAAYARLGPVERADTNRGFPA